MLPRLLVRVQVHQLCYVLHPALQVRDEGGKVGVAGVGIALPLFGHVICLQALESILGVGVVLAETLKR